MLTIRNLTIRYGELTIARDLSFHALENQWLMIVGPNGAGKSSIIGAIGGDIPYKGTISLDQENIRGKSPSYIAEKIAILSQSHSVSYAFTVEEVVRLGRYAHMRGILKSFRSEDERKVEEALMLTGLADIRTQSVLTLSGGELQRTFIAQVLAQDPALLILDEPANSLDLLYQKQLFDMIKAWSLQSGKAVISVVHDLSLAKAYGTHALLLKRGEMIRFGDLNEALSSDALAKAYEMDVQGWMRDLSEKW